ncbi:hypothetical protein Phi46:3_gp087 [Cellulophaga phage phi46:3]|uniref:Uncharacterized protein n=2 Tax=Pachyviridae TaxID=2946166 RepID=S0A353_9CAUD|nr:hypothetical protein Phi46:3_gp087 [Cellulophaga phage phi46:3]YP_008241284.1 hypothetical protein Phi18:3_gp091 [Cellulophaga phage phi18:3]AGO48603.1 hypothetical protein Phi18:3_gp091 [Cellulophaga phage phi18:3]AGO48831.1 hypothetical protein Phi46:3_gp087 [Cellulophaga phage phi46:3]
MKVSGIIAFILAIVMTIISKAPSFSQLALTLYTPLLDGFLFCIALAFLIRSKDALNRNDVILWKCETKYFDILSCVFFGLILITPVTHTEEFIQIAHMIATGMAILISYTALVAQQIDRMMKAGSIIGVVVGGVGFLIGFLTPYYSTGEGELIASLPLAVHMFFTKTK